MARRGGALAQPARASTPAKPRTAAHRAALLLLLGLGRTAPGSALALLRVLDLLPDRLGGGPTAIDRERALPCRDRLGAETVLLIGVAQMVEQHGIVLGEGDRA